MAEIFDSRSPDYIGNNEYRSSGRAVRPKDAATLIIVRRDAAEPKILMGKRAASHKFMPNKYVFPGGRVDPGDDRLKPPFDLHPDVLSRLTQHCSERRARGLALAAIRETWEETGLILGEPDTPTLRTRSPHWRNFLEAGVNPRLDTLQYIARAITPPHRNRRFDTRFFLAEADLVQGEVHERPEGSGELLELHWVGLDDAEDLNLANITRFMFAEVRRRIEQQLAPGEPGPFVHARRGKMLVEEV